MHECAKQERDLLRYSVPKYPCKKPGKFRSQILDFTRNFTRQEVVNHSAKMDNQQWAIFDEEMQYWVGKHDMYLSLSQEHERSENLVSRRGRY